MNRIQGQISRNNSDLIQSDLWLGSIMILLVLETTRRAVGIPMVIVTLFFIVHALYANYFFGFLYGPPTSFTKYIDIVFLRTEGIFGIPISVAATYIVLFIVFGAILIRTGAGRLFIDLAIALTGHRTGGPAKASVVASAFLGTVSGSAVANVVTTGSFTIPLMKRLGYRAKFAGAVEAAASSGGQFMPPVMGAVAFIMAERLTHHNLQGNSFATFLFKEDGPEYRGTRLYLKKVAEEKDSDLLHQLRRRASHTAPPRRTA